MQWANVDSHPSSYPHYGFSLRSNSKKHANTNTRAYKSGPYSNPHHLSQPDLESDVDSRPHSDHCAHADCFALRTTGCYSHYQTYAYTAASDTNTGAC